VVAVVVGAVDGGVCEDGVCGDGGFCAKATLVESTMPPAHRPILIVRVVDIVPPTDSLITLPLVRPTQPDAPT
jgi:hypothetical protein